MINNVTAEAGDVAANGDTQDGHDPFRLVTFYKTQDNQGNTGNPFTDGVANFSGCQRCHDLFLDAEVGHIANRKTDDP